MLSEDQGNEIVIEVEDVPPEVQRHLPSNRIVPEKTLRLANSSFSMVSSTSDIDVTDAQTGSRRHHKRAKRSLRFSTSLTESFSQTLLSAESVGVDTPCPSHENIQGSRTLGVGEDGSKEGFREALGVFSCQTLSRFGG